MSRILTKEEVALADSTGRQPWNEPTEIVPVPTPEEMAVWQPDPDPTKVRYRKQVNVSTGEVKYIELTLEEYRERHVNKIKSRNEYVLRKRAETKKAVRDALMKRLMDKIEADPTILDRI